MKLSLEVYFARKYESETKTKPKKPLTAKDRKFLEETCWKRVHASFVSRMSSGFLSGTDTIKDLEGEAWIAFQNIMEKFDKSKCGKIAKYDQEGADKPKSLEFYFLNYFYGRVNFMAQDTRTEKKKRGMLGPQASYNNETILYNPEDQSAGPDSRYQFDTVDFLSQALLLEPIDVRSLFKELYIDGAKVSELKKRYPDYLKLRRMLGIFLREFARTHAELLQEEVPAFRVSKRKGKKIVK